MIEIYLGLAFITTIFLIFAILVKPENKHKPQNEK